MFRFSSFMLLAVSTLLLGLRRGADPNTRGGRAPQLQRSGSRTVGTSWGGWASGARWLSCLAIQLLGLSLNGATPGDEASWHQGTGFRWRALPPVTGTRPGFQLLPPAQTGITFTNRLDSAEEAENHNLLNGSGLAAGDFDGDGRCDLFLCGLSGPSLLYRNLGDWRFEDVTAEAGLPRTNRFARGATFADVDGDVDLDLLVTYSGQGARLFLNNGRGQFTEPATNSLSAATGSTSLALADVDGDGDLDLYVANYGENTIRSGMRISTRMVGGQEQVVGRYRNRLKIIGGRLVEYGEPDVLYRNDGQGGFTAMSWTDGTFRDENGAPLTAAPWELGFTAVFHDINRDSHPDLYVCNDFQDPDRFWINDGRGRFQAIPRLAIRSVCNFSMTAAFGDLDRDGRDDLIVTDMLSRQHGLRMTQLSPQAPPIGHTLERAADRPQVRRNFLFWNRGDGTFADVAHFAGVAASDWSWTCVVLDADLDGLEDLFVGTGHYFDTQNLDAIDRTRTLSPAAKRDGRALLAAYPLLRTPNYAFRNRGDLTFEEVGSQWGFDSLQVSHSFALADFDQDGDLDLAVNCLKDLALIYRNEAVAPRVAVRLKGSSPNTQGIGARVTLRGGAVPEQASEVAAGGHYLSGDEALKIFAAGPAGQAMSIEVTWRSGRRSVVANVQPGRLYEVDEGGAGAAVPVEKSPETKPWFEDLSGQLEHRGVAAPADDFTGQPLLPRKLSHRGPVLAWADLDANGTEDLVIGGLRGGRPAAFLNDGSGGFKPTATEGGVMVDNTVGVAVVPATNGVPALLTASASPGSGGPTRTPLDRLELTGGKWLATPWPLTADGSLPVGNPGAMSLADFDGDGDLDLFLGGHAVPGRFPMAATSGFYRADPSGWKLDADASRTFRNVGLVNGALATDLDGDGRPELVLACEWGPLRIFRHDRGNLTDWDLPIQWAEGRPGVATASPPVPPPPSLGQLSGLWQCVAGGDFDGDGRMDLVAGNWGLNSTYQITAPGPWHLYYGDFAGDGGFHLLEGWFEPATQRVLPARDLTVLEPEMPWLRLRFPTHHAFAHATVPDLLGDRARSVPHLEISVLSSLLLLNRGDRFEVRPLPAEAQWAPVFGLGVGDFDGDGHEDLILAQNFFGVRREDGRLDAGRGLWLRGDGHGGFKAVPGQESGLRTYGEQRGCAVADFDGDGRLDLTLAQHGEETRLFRNRGSRPGLRVRLVGPPANPAGIGARLRVVSGEAAGPIREVRAGNGSGSQDSLVQVLTASGPMTAVEVRWPDGSVRRYAIGPGAKEVTLAFGGTVSP